MRSLLGSNRPVNCAFMINSAPTETPAPSPSVLEYLRQFARRFRPGNMAEA